MSTGMPAGIWLNKFGGLVRDYYGHVAYHVGSSLTGKTWRDVDVRLMLPDAEFEAQFGRNLSSETNPKLAAVTLAWASLGEKMTGLPIDFQIQQESWALSKYYAKPRNPLIEVLDRDPEAGKADQDKLEEMDRNARAYGFEVGRTWERLGPYSFPEVIDGLDESGSDSNPFLDPNWKSRFWVVEQREAGE